MTKTLYDPSYERDSCGTGFVVKIDGTASHQILAMALTAVTNLTHRGAVSADRKTGDGAGVLTQIPKEFFAREVKQHGDELEDLEDLAVGMIFFPQDNELREKCRAFIEDHVLAHEL